MDVRADVGKDVDRRRVRRTSVGQGGSWKQSQSRGGDRETTPDGTFRGKLLEKKTEEVYARTSALVTVQFNAQTKMVMGKPADIHAAAIVHATGTLRADRSLDAEQIVILTGYVRVE